MADFKTNNNEELLIDRIRKTGFGFAQESEFPKYNVLRIALSWALNANKIPLDSDVWEQKLLPGEQSRGKEYRLEQITGKGKEPKEDFDLLIRAMIYIKHKDELERNNNNLFVDDKLYLLLLSRYIHRGLYELQNTYKGSDCFYQWCLDHLDLSATTSYDTQPSQINTQPSHTNTQHQNYREKLEHFFHKVAIPIQIIREEDSYRHHLIRMEILDSTKIPHFKKHIKELDIELGTQVFVQYCQNVPRSFDIQILKDSKHWKKLSENELSLGLKSIKDSHFTLPVFAGFSIDKKPFCFDLSTTPHLFVAGTTGSGKTAVLKTIIVSLLQNKQMEEICIIDPKLGSFMDFKKSPKIKIINPTTDGVKYIDDLIKDMESRYARHADGISFDSMGYKVLVIDELASLVEENKGVDGKLRHLAQKARESRIHLILATQRPDAKLFSGSLRSNIPSRIALKVQKSTESKIILDEVGAENLSGSGDMLIKLINGDATKRVISIKIGDNISKFFPT